MYLSQYFVEPPFTAMTAASLLGVSLPAMHIIETEIFFFVK